MVRRIDVNCDMGEGFGAYTIGDEAALLRWISSANIACGFHAGDATVMRRTVRLCLERGVRIGAHPGLPDLQGFGRRTMALSAGEIYDIMLYQIGALMGIAQAEGGAVEHIKPHGALYHMAESDPIISEAIAQAVAKVAPAAALVGLSRGVLTGAGAALGLSVRHEAFADRGYRQDGTLLPRSVPGAVLTEPAQAAEQALMIAKDGSVRTKDGKVIHVYADTLCIHGDGPHALQHAQAISNALSQAGIVMGGTANEIEGTGPGGRSESLTSPDKASGAIIYSKPSHKTLPPAER
jgi:UPF0271 protein